MSNIAILILLTFVINFSGGNWKSGKVDSEGDLIIVEIENTECSSRNRQETISVDSDWSILIYYDYEIKSKYFIFNNIKKRIFSTKSFNGFLKELERIPDNTTIRDINKCTVSFSNKFPNKLRNKLNTIIKQKQCILEDKLMFCYCCAGKLNYPFLN